MKILSLCLLAVSLDASAAVRSAPSIHFVPSATVSRPAFAPRSIGLATALPRAFQFSAPEAPNTQALLMGLQQNLSSLPSGDAHSIGGSLTQFYSGSAKLSSPVLGAGLGGGFNLDSPGENPGPKRQEPPAPKNKAKRILANLFDLAILAGGAAVGALVALPWWAGPLTLVGGFVVFGVFSIADAWVNSRKFRAIANVAVTIAGFGAGVSLGALGAWIASFF